MNKFKAITLVEILVASLIMAIVISGMLFSFTTYLKLVKSTSKRYEATTILNQKFEQVQRCTSRASVENLINGFVTGINGDGTFTGGAGSAQSINLPGVDAFNTAYSIEYDTLTVTGADNTDILKVYARVNWTYLGNSDNISMLMYALKN